MLLQLWNRKEKEKALDEAVETHKKSAERLDAVIKRQREEDVLRVVHNLIPARKG